MRVGLCLSVLLLSGASALACDRQDSARALPTPGIATTGATGLDQDQAQEILLLVNQERSQAGQAPLALDASLTLAAQAHGREMLQHDMLSHQFPGEADLFARLGQTGAHFNRAGENVAFDFSAQHTHQSFMASEPHRRNLLDPNFNAVGIAVVADGCQIYVVQDFAHELPKLEPGQAEDLIAEKVATLRTQTRLPRLRRVKSPAVSDACSASKTKQKHSSPDFSNARYVLNYSNSEPQALPSNIGSVIGNGQMKDFSVGACYARTEKNPNGAYFVTMRFY